MKKPRKWCMGCGKQYENDTPVCDCPAGTRTEIIRNAPTVPLDERKSPYDASVGPLKGK